MVQALAPVLDGLEYAHSARGIDGRPLKVVHRDLTPSNILVTTHGEVKIVDFGIAKAIDSDSFTQTGKFSGKLSYMPPEQMRGESIDARADLFSLGVILAESVRGSRTCGATPPARWSRRACCTDEIPSLDDVVDVPPELRAICGARSRRIATSVTRTPRRSRPTSSPCSQTSAGRCRATSSGSS